MTIKSARGEIHNHCLSLFAPLWLHKIVEISAEDHMSILTGACGQHSWRRRHTTYPGLRDLRRHPEHRLRFWRSVLLSHPVRFAADRDETICSLCDESLYRGEPYTTASASDDCNLSINLFNDF